MERVGVPWGWGQTETWEIDCSRQMSTALRAGSKVKHMLWGQERAATHVKLIPPRKLDLM